MTNMFHPEFDEQRDHPGFNCRRARVGRQAGAVTLGASLWEIPPGQSAYPYHFHLGEEEVIFLLSGTLSLRTPEGWRELSEGEVVAFPVGAEGAHQVTNRSEETVRMLAISTEGTPDIIFQPETGKIGAFERKPGGGGLRMWWRERDAADYWEGVQAPGV